MVSRKAWRIDAAVWLASALFLSLCVGSIAKLLIDRWSTKASDHSFVAFVIGAVSFHGIGLILIYVFLKLHQVNWREFLGIDQPGWKEGARFAALLSLLIIPATLLLNWLSAQVITLFEPHPEEQMVMQMLEHVVGIGQKICFGVTAVVLAPVVEESLFRGILYPLIKDRGFPMLALSGTSLLFAAVHANLLTFLPLTFLAIVLVLVYERTETLVAPIVLHACFNAVNFTLYQVIPKS